MLGLLEHQKTLDKAWESLQCYSELILKLLKKNRDLFKMFIKSDFRKVQQSNLSISFDHMTSIYTFQDTSGCRGGP